MHRIGLVRQLQCGNWCCIIHVFEYERCEWGRNASNWFFLMCEWFDRSGSVIFLGLTNGHHKTPSSLHGHKNGVSTPSTPKPPSLSSATDFTRIVIPGSPSATEQQLPANINSPSSYSTTLPNDFSQPLSVPTRLQSLNLINEAFRRFSAIEATLAAQRKQSQMTSSIHAHRSRLNSTANNSTTTMTTKQQQQASSQTNNETTIAQAQS